MKSVHEESAGRLPPWLITYSDLVTLLLTFFVLLMSMANLDPVKFTKASSSLKSAFGFQARPDQVEFAVPLLPTSPKTTYQPVIAELTKKIHQQLKTQLDKLELDRQVKTILSDQETIIVRINDHLLFEPASAELKADASALLEKMAQIIGPLQVDLRIEGHTDNSEMAGNAFSDNWALSVARAVAVARFYHLKKLLDLDRIGAIGYGDTRPVVPNTDRHNRALNRRVDFVLRANLPSGTSPASKQRSTIPL